jgi:aryl-alcohol dehydrogenase-like predicted oxidoreductase
MSGIEVSVLGLGTVKLGRSQGVKYPEAFVLPDDREVGHLLCVAESLGINLLDTAPAYGHSEERLGKQLKGHRQNWVISTKAGETFIDGKSYYDFSEQAVVQSVEASLRRLQTDYIDILLIHSNGDDEEIILEHHIFDTLKQLRQAGKIRAFGMSTKTVAGGILTVEQAEVAMVTYHPSATDDLAVIQRAHALNKGILIKKAFASGHSKLSASECMSFVLAEPGVSSVIVGTINPLHLRENAASVCRQNFHSLSVLL